MLRGALGKIQNIKAIECLSLIPSSQRYDNSLIVENPGISESDTLIPGLSQTTGIATWQPTLAICLGLYSLSGKTSYHQISWSLEAVRLCYNDRFDLTFDRHLGSAAAEVSVKFLHIHGWGTTQRREWILDELRNRFCTIFAKDSWPLSLAIRYLYALIQKDPYICNYNVLYTLVRWYLTESNHKCSRMCLWHDVDMQRIIDELEIVVTDYLRRRNRLLTNG